MASYNNSSQINDISYTIPSFETVHSRMIKFILLLLFQLLSITCSLFLLFHLIKKPTLHRALHNHTLIALVIVSFFQTISDLPMTLDYLRMGQASSSIFCFLWNFFALSNYAVGVWIMTWASFERHLLIFHERLTITSRGRILYHYIPLLISFALPWIYYVILIFFYPCTNTFYPTFLFCGWCCYAYNDQLVFFNWMMFGVIPTCLISLFCVWLIIRVIAHKRRVQQRINWRQHRRMTIQLLSISSLYIFFDAPTIIIGLVRLGLPTFGNEIQILYLFYIVYLLPILVPFVCLSTLRELWSGKQTQIHPTRKFTQNHTTGRTDQPDLRTRFQQITKV
uniref:Seven transmembrane helix receptor-like protein n=1 Tax=Adineta vaga TaxID=104782 RepID=B3G4A3_ADIVA|nr:seven transmembrane helix receptor-like protein [Adineta vaga]